MRETSKFNKCICTDCGINCDLFEHEETGELVCRECLFGEKEDEEEEE
jgi:hypothetical protein